MVFFFKKRYQKIGRVLSRYPFASTQKKLKIKKKIPLQKPTYFDRAKNIVDALIDNQTNI